MGPVLDRRLIEEMYTTAKGSDLDGAKKAAVVYEKMLNMTVGQAVTVQFEPGEDFSIKRTVEGYEIL